jgi:hypothetical protein
MYKVLKGLFSTLDSCIQVKNLKFHSEVKKLHGLSPHANYTDRLSDRRLSAKLVPTLADRGCCVVSAGGNISATKFNYESKFWQ